MGVQGTKRRSRGRGELHRRLYRSQRGAQEARESRTNVCTEHTKAPNRCPRGFKLGPRSVQDSQVEPKRHPRGSKLGPRGAQEAPSWAQEASKRSNLSPKTCEIAVQDHLNCKKARTSNFDDPTTLFEGLERSGGAAEGQVGAHFGCAESKLELRRPPWSPNRLGQCSQYRQYRAKWRPGGQGGMYEAPKRLQS